MVIVLERKIGKLTLKNPLTIVAGFIDIKNKI